MVVEFCSVAAGPFCGMLLADMGADVVKVEPHAGDTLRQWPPIIDGFSENFVSLNRNKRSIALDLKSDEGRETARQLVLQADVVVENNRAGAMDRLGLGYTTFAEEKPSLVYCSLSAFGQSGPRANEGGFDLTIQAISGIMSVTGEADGEAVKCGVPISDFSSGLYAAFSISSMIARVRGGGNGGFIDVSMLGASLAVSALQTSEFFGSGNDPRRLGAAHPRNAPYQAFRAKDGSFAMAAGNDKLWRTVCEVIGRADLLLDERYVSTQSRATHQRELVSSLHETFASRTVDDLLAAFEAAGVPCARINSFSEALADRQVKHMGWVRDIEVPGGRVTRTFGSPIQLDGASLPIRRAPPELDGNRAEILHELDRARDPLSVFIRRIETLLADHEGDQHEIIGEVRKAVGVLVSRDHWLEPRFAAADQNHYQQHLIYLDPLERFSIVSFVWGPGQRTPVHDHKTWGVIGMLRGSEISENFELVNSELAPIDEVRLLPGDTAVVSPTLGDIHRVRNALGDSVSISIHVYGADIGSIRRSAYRSDGTKEEFVSGYASRFDAEMQVK